MPSPSAPKSKPVTIGLVINPIAGVGGQIGLKGSDTIENLQHAITMGGTQQANHRMAIAIDAIKDLSHRVVFKTAPTDMGACVLNGFDYECVIPQQNGATTAEQTKQCCQHFWRSCDLVVFAGGDGTARDIFSVYDFKTPVLGIPAGVKIQSGVFATTPAEAGTILHNFIRGHVKTYTDCDVMDLDESLLQDGIVAPCYHGYMRVPDMPHFMQNAKFRMPSSEDSHIYGIAQHTQPILQDGGLHIVGPGKTTFECLNYAGLEGTLIGVDVIHNNRTVIKDATAKQILSYCQNRPIDSIMVGCIGGQGILFGRGNQQITPAIIKQAGKKNIMVLASPNKLVSLHGKPFRVDTGCAHTDTLFNGVITVINGFGHKSVYPVKTNTTP